MVDRWKKNSKSEKVAVIGDGKKGACRKHFYAIISKSLTWRPRLECDISCKVGECCIYRSMNMLLVWWIRH
jgi:hypothetical protein